MNDAPHISQVQDRLYHQFLGLIDETIDPKRAVEVNNTAGKLMSTYKSQLAYHAMRGEAPNIPFLAAPVDSTKTFLGGADAALIQVDKAA